MEDDHHAGGQQPVVIMPVLTSEGEERKGQSSEYRSVTLSNVMSQHWAGTTRSSLVAEQAERFEL